MKVVIDIDENLYTRLFDNGVDNYDDAADMAKAIRKGTPLPKGHGRIGDFDLVDNHIHEKWMNNEISNEDWIRFREWLRDEPTLIEADKEVEK